MNRISLLLSAVVVVGMGLLGTSRVQAQSITLFEPLDPQRIASKTATSSSASWHPVRVRRDVMQSVDAGQRVQFPISDDEHWEGAVQRVERRGPESVSLFGIVDGSPAGQFVITLDGGGLMATFQVPEKNLVASLRSLGGDDYALITADAATVRRFECGVGSGPDRRTKSNHLAFEAPEPSVVDITAPPPQHDVLVLYTQGLVNDFPNHWPNTPLSTAIQHCIDYSNQAYVNSGVSLRLRLAYRGLVDPSFSEAGHDRYWLLDHLVSTSDGILDQAHSLRQTYHADIVCLMYSLDTQNMGGGGLANLLDPATFATNNPANYYPSAFCVVEGLWEPTNWDPPLSGEVVNEFTHEIGHTQGLDHNCEDSQGNPVTSYAYGWRFIGNTGRHYVTIMSYRTGAYVNAAEIAFFSNPAISYDGQPTGTNAPGCSGATTGARDAIALGLSADFMSRLRLQPLDPWVDFGYGGTQNGRFATPWSTPQAAINDLPYTDGTHTPTPPTLSFKGPAAYGPTTITMNKRMRLEAQGGAVRIGGP